MLRTLLLLLTLLAVPAAAPARAQAAVEAVLDDGPYVLWKGREARVLKVRAGNLQETTHSGPFDLDLPGLAPGPLRLAPAAPAPAPAEYPLPAKILAVSDVHGNLDTLRALFLAHGVVDAALRWRFGRGHVVVVGDVFDRGPRVTEALWFLRALEAQAAKAGGRVHLLLGNHEAMILQGDLRYLHPRYRRLLQTTLPLGLAELFGPASELGRWLRTRPTLLKLGPFLFVHGGLSARFLDLKLGLGAANAALRDHLDTPKVDARTAFLFGPEGPLWYRGFVAGAQEGGDAAPDTLARALRAFKVRAVVIGHTTVDRISSFHGGQVYAIDAGLKNQKTGEVWICRGGKVFRGTVDGHLEEL